MKTFVVLISAVAVASPAFAQTSGGIMAGSGAELSERTDSPESTSAPTEGTADGERRICRRINGDSSSRLSQRRVCRTAAEWRQTQR